MSMKLLKKPMEVEGVRWTGKNFDEVKAFAGDSLIKGENGDLIIKTLEGDHQVIPNAVVIKGVAGEFYPVEPSIFERTFYVINEDDALDEPALEALTTLERKGLKDSQFAVPSKRVLPINDAKHIKMAWDMLSIAKGLTTEERKNALVRIKDAAKEIKLDTSAWKAHRNVASQEDYSDAVTTTSTDWSLDVLPYLLNQLSEESSELGQAASKAIRFGLDSVDPKTQRTCRERIVEEGNDVLGVIRILNNELAQRGIAPIIGIGNMDLVVLSIGKRNSNLVKEFDAGRFTFKMPVEG